MAEIESPIQEELDRLDASIRDLRRLIVTANGGHSNPAPTGSHTSDAAVLLAQEEVADELRRLRASTESLPERIAACLEERFAVEEELDEPEPKAKKGANAKGDKAKDEDADEEPEPLRRRAYFRERDAE